MSTGHALAAFDESIITRETLNSIIERGNDYMQETQRKGDNTRRDEFERVQTMLTPFASKIDDFKSSYLDPTLSPVTDTVLFRFFEASSASADNITIFFAYYAEKKDASSIYSDATTVDPADNHDDFDMDEEADEAPEDEQAYMES